MQRLFCRASNGHPVSNGGLVRCTRPVGPWSYLLPQQLLGPLFSALISKSRNFSFFPSGHALSCSPSPFHVVSALHLSLSPLVLHLISIFYLPAPLFPPSKGLQLLPLPCPACTLTYTPFPPFHLCPNNTLCYFVCVVGIWIRDQEVSDLKSQEIYLNFIVTVMMATTNVWQVASSDPLLWHKHYCYSNFQMRLRDLEKDAVIHWRLVTPRSTFAS